MKKSMLLFTLFFSFSTTVVIGSMEENQKNTTQKGYVEDIDYYTPHTNVTNSWSNQKFEKASQEARDKNNKQKQLEKKSTPTPTLQKKAVVGSAAWAKLK